MRSFIVSKNITIDGVTLESGDKIFGMKRRVGSIDKIYIPKYDIHINDVKIMGMKEEK